MQSTKKIFFILFFVLFFVFPRISHATSWNAVIDDNFNRSNTSVGSANSTTGVGNGWIDVAGNTWNISSNTLQGTSSASSDYLSKFLARPSTENSKDQREIVTIPANENFTGDYLGVVLRYQSSTGDHYLAHIGASGVFVYKIVGGTTTLITSTTVSLSTTDSYSVDFSATGSNSTALSVVVTDLTTSTQVATASGTDSSATLQGTGSFALSNWYNSGTHFIHASRVQTFNSTPASYTLTYSAGVHGSLTGTTTQTVSPNGSGSAVTAVPTTGYTFINWSDSSTANPRTDTSVASNISVTANFADITAPSVPGTPTVSAANTNTPTWSWSPSTDSGSGIYNYLIKWSHNSDCSGGFNTTTGGLTNYTIPSGSQMTDGTWYFCVAAEDTATNISAYSAAGTVTTDTIPPVISNITIAPLQTNAMISWTTNELASSIVNYGLTSAYATAPNGNTTPEINTTSPTTSHSVMLSNLTCGTLYYFNVQSRDPATNSTSSQTVTFATTGCRVQRNTGSSVTPRAFSPTAVTASTQSTVQSPAAQSPLDFIVDNGASTTSSPILSIAMNADTATVKGYSVSLDPTFAKDGIYPYTGNITSFTLPDVAGTYKIYFKYYSISGEPSDLLSKTIIYKKENPIVQTLLSRSLSFGNIGNDVFNLQKFLNTHGFIISKTGAGSPGNETNIFGSKVMAAVKQYQKANNIIPANGTVGPITLKAMTAQQ